MKTAIPRIGSCATSIDMLQPWNFSVWSSPIFKVAFSHTCPLYFTKEALTRPQYLLSLRRPYVSVMNENENELHRLLLEKQDMEESQITTDRRNQSRNSHWTKRRWLFLSCQSFFLILHILVAVLQMNAGQQSQGQTYDCDREPILEEPYCE